MMSVLQFAVALLYCITCVSACPAMSQCQCVEQILFCVGANFTEIPDDIPANIMHLDFHAGQLEVIEADKLGHFIHLKQITMDKNKISEVENGTFDRLVEVIKISFNENNIRYLMPGIFSKLKQLRYLLLSENVLTSIEGLFTGLTELESLNLDSNRIQHLSIDVFRDLSKLHDLQLNNNNIKEIPPDTFRYSPALTIIGLGSNPISVLDNVFHQNSNLHYINLTDCKFTTFPSKLPSSLKYVRLGKNNITRILKNETERYHSLVTLIMEENRLEYIEENAFTDMSSLADLFLFVNNLTQIPGKFPRSIQNLYLDSNKITSIPIDTFETNTELRMLSLRSNNIGTFNTAAFKTVSYVKALKLDGNSLRILHDNIFLQVSGLQHLTLNRLDIHEIYPNCLLGLDTLQTLEMSWINIDNDRGILGNFLIHVPTLESLDLSKSPALAHYFLSHVTIMESVANLTHLNLAENGLTTLPAVLPWHLPYLLKLHLAGNPINCTEDNFWLQEWYMMEPSLFQDIDHVYCHSPPHLHGQLLKDVDLLTFGQNNLTDIVTTEVNHYDYSDYYDSVTDPNYDDDYYDEYDFSDVNYEFDYDNYDFMTLSTVVITDQVRESTTPAVSVTQDPNVVSITTTEQNKDKGTNKIRSAAITVGMAFGVICIMMLIAGIAYCICLRRNRNIVHHNARNNNGANDYVFIVSKTEIQNETETKPQRKLTREERGSTTSQASQDITNDTALKVYTLDMNK